MDPERSGDIIEMHPATASPAEIALDQLEHVYAFLYRRVGNRADAEDLTQEVALKAVPRLYPGASVASIRSYLFATARTELARFWAKRFGLPEEELREDLPEAEDAGSPREQASAAKLVSRILGQLPANYAQLLELRFLRGYSTREIARELGSTVGGVRIMQLRALRAAAQVDVDA